MKKYIIIGSIIGLLIIGVGGYYGFYKYQQYKKSKLVLIKNLGLTDAEKQQFVDRINSLKDSLSKIKDDKKAEYRTYIDIAANYMGMGEYEQSKDWLDKAKSVINDDPLVYAQMAELQKLMLDSDGAIKSYQKALDIDPGNVVFWSGYLDLSKVKIQNDPKELAKLYEKAITATSSNFEILVRYARYKAEQKDLISAVEMLKKAKESSPQNAAQIEQEIINLQNLVK